MKLDLKEGYYHIYIKERDKWKTTFRIHYRQYEYLVIPMRLINASAIFQRIINQILYYKLDYTVIVYLDNILIYT